MHLLTGCIYVGVIGRTDCDVRSNYSFSIWSFSNSVIGGPPFISGYDLNFARLDLIVGSVSFSFFRCASSSPIFLFEWEWSLLLMIKIYFPRSSVSIVYSIARIIPGQ